MSSFEERLWSELAFKHGEPLASTIDRTRPTRRQMARRNLAAGGAALAAAGIVAATLALSTGSTTPAYAIVVNHDGSVTLTLNQLLGTKDANARLANLGVRVRIIMRERGCSAKRELAPLGTELLGEGGPLRLIGHPQTHTAFGGLAVLIHPNMIPPGDTVVITARLIGHRNGDGTSHAIGMSAGLYRTPPPTCLPI